MPWGRIFGDIPKLFRQESVGYLQTFVGRQGLDPGTLGIGPEHPVASVVVQITWSGASARPPTSMEIHSNLSLWLHHWLHSLGNSVSGDVKICGADGFEIQLLLEGPNA